MSAGSRDCPKGRPGKIRGVCLMLAFFYLVQSQIEREEKKKSEYTTPWDCQVGIEQL